MFAERVKLFAKDILYYGIGNMLYSIVQFISMPLVVKSMDKQQVADWNILLPTGVLLSAVVMFGMDAATVRFLKDAENDEQRATIFSTGFFFELSVAGLVAVFLLLVPGTAGEVLHLSPGENSSWLALLCWLPGIIMAQYFQNWFKYTFRRSSFVKLICIQSAVYLGGIIFLKFTNQLSLFNIMLVMVASQWLTALAGFIACSKLFVFSIDKKLLKQLLAYGFPFMILAFGFNFIMTMDRYILAGRIGKEEFAVYTQAVRITAIVTMIVSSFNFSFGPFSLSLLGKPDAEKTFARFHSYYLILMSFLGLSFIAFGKVIINIFAGPGYLEGYPFFLFLVGGYILYGLYSFAQLGIIYSKKSYLGIYVLVAGVATCGTTGLLLANRYSGYGTAIGFLLANLVMVILANYYSARHLHIRYHLVKDIFLLLLFGVIGCFFTQVSFSESIVIDGIVKFSALLIIMPITGFFLLTSEEKSYLGNVFVKNRAKRIE